MDVTPFAGSRAAHAWLWFRFVLFFGMHAAVLAAMVLVPPTTPMVALFGLSYALRLVGITVGYHRYFAHKAFRTSRPVQLLLAILAQSANQNGVLWWAARHRHHHARSDQPEDVHSPVQHGFLRAHLTWFMYPEAWPVDDNYVRDWLKVPELVLLQKLPFLPTLTLALVLLGTLGWPGLLWGHVVPTVALLHATFSVNSLTHMSGSQPHDTGDASRNHPLIAALTFGEGWHNNHHHRPRRARFGEVWWQVDVGYGVIWVLERLGLVWDVQR